MILQSLNNYYQRLLDDPDQKVPEPGFSREKIHFELVLSPQGRLLGVNNLQKAEGKRLVPWLMSVPQAVKRASGIAPNSLWDNTGYVLGADAKGKPERARKQFAAFCQRQHELLDDVDDPGARALLAFLDSWEPEQAADLGLWDEMAGKNVVFHLDGEYIWLHDRPALRAAVSERVQQSDSRRGLCLVTGLHSPLARLHASIKGVRGAQTSGASLVAFNQDSFKSYGKEQSYNAPVSEEAAFAYCTALNHMLAGDSHRVQVGDATTVFWSEKPTQVEAFFAGVMGGSAKTDSKKAHHSGMVKQLRDLLEAVSRGNPLPDWVEREVNFYVLGLSPNASRLSVRFWHVSKTSDIARRLAEHFQDLSIERRYDSNPEFPGMWQLLIDTATQHKSENINPRLSGELMRAILSGAEYPRMLVSQVLSRINAEKEVTYARAALLKAFLNRSARKASKPQEVAVTLDPENKNPGYLLGRLFAVMEKAQLDALGKVNATIKDRYYAAASATPASVFPRLIRLAQHHIAKAEYGQTSDRRMAEIVENLDAFPAHLDMDGQAKFALGYYHQRNANYRKNPDTAAEPEDKE